MLKLKNSLKFWTKNNHKEPHKRKEELQKEMEIVQENIQGGKYIKENQLKEKEVHWETYRNNKTEEEEWRLKSGNIWI